MAKRLRASGEAGLMRAIELNGVAIDFNKQAFNWGRVAAHDLAAVKKLVAPAQVIELKRAPTLDDIITKRIAFLTDYQDAAYALQYSDFVNKVKAAEAAIADGKPLRLTEAVAKYLFKLMAYKDEYEVARLYTDGKFQKKIADMFEGDYAVHFHLAPPLFAKHDAQGHLIKQHYGPWMMKVFGVLAKMKSLRGSMFDVFGYTAERRTERALVMEYKQTILQLLPLLNAGNLASAVAVASVPEDIRGYGHVKERHLLAAKNKQATLLAEFNTVAAPQKAA
jgi:indolepyruvate ferredoxin oxidoreductase